MYDEISELMQLFYKKLKIEYDKENDEFNFIDNSNNEVVYTMKMDEAKILFNINTVEHLNETLSLSKSDLAKLREQVIYRYFDLGEDLNGGNLNYRDLELALITGRDLDGVDIPNDTPEERQREEYSAKGVDEFER